MVAQDLIAEDKGLWLGSLQGSRILIVEQAPVAP